MASSSYARKVLPKKLEEDLANIPSFKPREVPLLPTGSTAYSGKQGLHKVLDDSIERAMFDEILGPLVNPKSYRRPQTMQSPTRPASGLGSYGENVINMHNHNNSNLSGFLKSAISSSPSSSSSLHSGMNKDAGTATTTSPRKIAGNSPRNVNIDTDKNVSNSFNDSILARLTSVEADNKAMRKQLAEKIQKLEQVEAENARLRRVLLEVDDDEDEDEEGDTNQVVLGADGVLRGTINASAPDSQRYGHQASSASSMHAANNRRLLEEVEELRQENMCLEQQVSDMEQFLSDYGLTWVGNEGLDGGVAAGKSARSAPDATAPTTTTATAHSSGAKAQAKTVPDSKSYHTLNDNDNKPSDVGASNISNISTTRNLVEWGQLDTRSSGNLPSATASGDTGTGPVPQVRMSPHKYPNIYHVDFHTFKMKIDSLNAVIYSEPAQVKHDKYGNGKTARIMQPSEFMEKVPVTFFNNGILIRRGPFRPHDSASYKAFCRDVLDGYFPSDFRNDHPDGVLFELFDKHREEYSVESLSSASVSSSSNGRTLIDGNIHGDGNFSRQYTKEQLLQNLSGHKVNARGDVINVRGDVSEKLNLSAAEAGAGGKSKYSSSINTHTGRVVSNLVTGYDKIITSEVKPAAASPVPAGSKSSSRRAECVDVDAPPSYKLSGLLQSSERLAQLSQREDANNNNNSEAKVKSGSSRTGNSAGASASNVIIINTSASEPQVRSDASGENTALIRIKWIDGTMLHMKLWETDLVGDIRENIRRHIYNTRYDQDYDSTDSSYGGLVVNDSDAFDLRAAYPPRMLSNTMTLSEAGLVPNGTVHAMIR